ncbi:hypothetical protein CHEID_08630 [Corynebacterium heidelbergense]|uniref:DUF3017 domain-containing protein n=1 Tax=Corynebacterium heidelbergense TaxID=2055947 RepID=UPI0023590B4A|nr:DUF3017 domain-containing protein [Corynebacterium heidelbergense]WCZ37256.1 hypothetical protein CHEID_08630 [Corynebacterium heidelbergense]
MTAARPVKMAGGGDHVGGGGHPRRAGLGRGGDYVGRHQQAPHQVGTVRRKLLHNPHDVANPPSQLSPAVQYALVGVVVALVFGAAVFIALERWRRGGALFGAALLMLSVIRWMVDSQVLGVLAVRSRRFDSLFTGFVGAFMLFLAVSVDSLGS